MVRELLYLIHEAFVTNLFASEATPSFLKVQTEATRHLNKVRRTGCPSYISWCDEASTVYTKPPIYFCLLQIIHTMNANAQHHNTMYVPISTHPHVNSLPSN
jgi:hypothetical protein